MKPRHKVLGITARLTNGKLGGQSYEITPKTAAKLGSVDQWSFIKSTFKPPVADKVVADVGEDVLQEAADVSDNSSNMNLSLSDDSKADISMAQTEELTPSQSDVECPASSIESADEVVMSLSGENTDIQEPNEAITKKLSKVNQDEHSNFEFESVSPICDSDEIAESDTEKQAVQLSKVDIMQDYLSSLPKVAKINYDDPESFEAMKEEQRRKREEEKEFNKKIAKMHGWDGFDAAFVVSAKHGDGIGELKVTKLHVQICLCRSHIMQYHFGYCKLELLRGYAEGI